jgi:hypothetical protein
VGVVLVCVVLVSFALAWWDEWQTAQDEKVSEEDAAILEFETRSVTMLGWHGSSAPNQRWQAERVEGEWRVTEPRQGAADGGVLQELLDTLRGARAQKRLPIDVTRREEFGLANPEPVIEIRWVEETPKSARVLVGDNAPVGYSCYLAVETGGNIAREVVVVGQHLCVLLRKSPETWARN